MQTRLSLRYIGPAVDAGLMDVYEAAANMIAFSEFVVLAAKAAFGEKVDAKAEVAGFGRGSFITEIVINLGGPLATLFTTGNVKNLLDVIDESVKLWKHLAGSPPQHLKPGPQNTVTVTNNNGEVLIVQGQTVHLVFDEKSADAVTKFVHDALREEGMDGMSIDAEYAKKPMRIAQVSRDESQWFVPVAPEIQLFDSTLKAALIIESPVFKEDNKWRFSDGGGSFYADIADADFLTRVDNGEPFAKGDSLIVELRIQQRRQGEKLLTEKTIVKVLEHRSKPSQGLLM